MSDTVHFVDVTSTSENPRIHTVEVETDAGTVRVNTKLVTVRGGQPSVVVEVEPRQGWDTETREMSHRIDTIMIKRASNDS